MRMPRVKAEGQGFYHCISRIIERRYIFEDEQIVSSRLSGSAPRARQSARRLASPRFRHFNAS
jgi:hypothetical protein